MKKISRILTLTLALVLALALALPAWAVTTPPTLPENESGKVQFDKVFTVEANAVVPELTFTFELTAETAPGVGNWVARQSQVTGVITAVAAESDANYSSNVSGLGVANDKGTLTVKYGAITTPETDKQELRRGFVLDFNGIIKNSLRKTPATGTPSPDGYVTEPGMYRYKIAEINQNDDRIDYTNIKEYYIDIFVQWGFDPADNANPAEWLEIANIVVTPVGAEGNTYKDYTITTDDPTKTETGYDNATKVDGTPKETTNGSGTTASSGSKATFEQSWKSYSLTVDKTVTGNQGSRTQQFTFTIDDVDDVPDGTYNITYSGGTISGNPSIVTVSSGLPLSIQLTHGMSFTIQGLPYGAHCKITETVTGYTTTYQINNYGSATSGRECDLTAVTYPDGLDQDITVYYINDKSGTVPTGILLTIAPFVALMGIGLLGAVLVLKKKRD